MTTVLTIIKLHNHYAKQSHVVSGLCGNYRTRQLHIDYKLNMQKPSASTSKSDCVLIHIKGYMMHSIFTTKAFAADCRLTTRFLF